MLIARMRSMVVVALFWISTQSLRVSVDKAPMLEDYCQHVYLDMGANLGVQVRKLFQPAEYQGANISKVFDKYFGGPDNRSKPSLESGICAIGIEANPHWVGRLKAVEEFSRRHEWHVQFLVPRVVHDVEGENITFWIDDTYPIDIASSISRTQANLSHSKYGNTSRAIREVTVASLDIAAFINHTILSTRKKTVVAKMDIEGSEYIVIPKMLEQGLLCKGNIDALIVTWHRTRPEGYESSNVTDLRKKIVQGASCGNGRPTDIFEMEDESYQFDGVPMDFHEAHLMPRADVAQELHATADIYAAAQRTAHKRPGGAVRHDQKSVTAGISL
eukprot:gnl/TRDRNA2_/TRDRNA2_93104_c0_seq2.p1 gnl/TRDRNA2_/TRDRNA2_93104_c0~~gnl/TRDRNA2_/TRDRNA2_93104_c0_seq2.p1  ORF type:complete len:331 (+),score=43.27 gnl/TRDRNA2_/TRDRNA2_93104_c0_seq2:1-993(+)